MRQSIDIRRKSAFSARGATHIGRRRLAEQARCVAGKIEGQNAVHVDVPVPDGASRLTKSLGLVEYGDELIVKEILSPD